MRSAAKRQEGSTQWRDWVCGPLGLDLREKQGEVGAVPRGQCQGVKPPQGLTQETYPLGSGL